jgi:hypothetical protein
MKCPHCGNIAYFLPNYKRYYCYRCGRWIEIKRKPREIEIGTWDVIKEIFIRKELRNAGLLAFFFNLVIVFLPVGLAFYLYSLWKELIMENLAIFIFSLLTLTYVVGTLGTYLTSIFFYLILDPYSNLSDARRKLSGLLGKRWLIAPFLLLSSYFRAFIFFFKQLGFRIWTPLTGAWFVWGEFSIMITSLLFPVMAFERVSGKEAIERMSRFVYKHFKFFRRKGIFYRIFLPLLIIFLWVGSWFLTATLSLTYDVKGPILFLIFPALPIILIILIFWLIYARSIIYARLYAKRFQQA